MRRVRLFSLHSWLTAGGSTVTSFRDRKEALRTFRASRPEALGFRHQSDQCDRWQFDALNKFGHLVSLSRWTDSSVRTRVLIGRTDPATPRRRQVLSRRVAASMGYGGVHVPGRSRLPYRR